jgi:hypothetical protein
MNSAMLINDSEFPLLAKSLHSIISAYQRIYSSNLQHPVFLLVLWWIFCVYFKLIVLNLLPLSLLIWLSFKWNNNNDNTTTNIQYSLKDCMTKIEKWLEESTMAKKYFSWSYGYARSSFIWLLHTYIIWISAQQILGTRSLFIMVGSCVVIWKSDWISPMKKKTAKIMRYQFITQNSNSKKRLWNRLQKYQEEEEQQKQTGSFFLFELYENQVRLLLLYYYQDILIPSFCILSRD